MSTETLLFMSTKTLLFVCMCRNIIIFVYRDIIIYMYRAGTRIQVSNSSDPDWWKVGTKSLAWINCEQKSNLTLINITFSINFAVLIIRK